MTYVQPYSDKVSSYYAEDDFDLSASSSSTEFKPETFFLYDLGRTISLVEPILLSIEYEEDGCVIALCKELDTWSDGENFLSAVENTKIAIRGLYISLIEDKDKLGPMPQKYLEFLQNKIDE